MNKLHPLQQISFNEPNQAWVVEASAGTGKTWTIERLYIKALLEASHPHNVEQILTVDNILVVTFTNDATNELKERIADLIELTINLIFYLNNGKEDLNYVVKYSADLFMDYLLARSEQDNYDFHKDILILTRALQAFDSAAIYTIHGFCHRILQDYQLECLSNGYFELIANKHSLVEELVRNFWRCRIINNPELKDGIDNVYANLTKLFAGGGDLAADLIRKIAAKLPTDLLKLTTDGYALKYNFPDAASLRLLSSKSLDEDAARMAKSQFLAEIANYIVEYYPKLAINLGKLSYDELIQKVSLALMTNISLADKIFNEFPLAFIDEFQDTDSEQWTIFNKVYQLDGAKRGNVVVVGDPKQAIYRFRGADIDTYLMARRAINNSLELSANFRSHPQIMNFINQLFSLENQNSTPESSFLGSGIDYYNVSATVNRQFQLPNAEILNDLATDKQIKSRFYDEPVQLVVVPGATGEERKKTLLQAVTQEILMLLTADPSLSNGKIAILVTKNREANELVNYLRKFGVRAAELKLGSIYNTTTANDLYNILLAIEDISNRHNFFKALASRIFNLDLSRLNLNNDNPAIEEWQRNFFHYRSLWREKGIVSLLYVLLEDIIVTHQTATDCGGIFTPRELANLWQLAELLNAQAEKIPNHGELLFWLRQKIVAAQNNPYPEDDAASEELIRLDNDDEQIIITTQHKAKGLEYEILFCPYFKAGIKLDGTYDYNYRRPFFNSSNYGIKTESALIIDEARGCEIVSEDNKEAHRLNYVALTRAKSRLYIYLKQPTISKSSGKYNATQRPDKLAELFGFNFADERDSSHPLFNYPLFFSSDPQQALKYPQQLPGVVAYRRDSLIEDDLVKLRLNDLVLRAKIDNFYTVAMVGDLPAAYRWQSYSSLTASGRDERVADYFVSGEVAAFTPPTYRYTILNDKNLHGAVFGILFHELCENYPLTLEQIITIIKARNVDGDLTEYGNELLAMLNEAFAYPLFTNGASIKNILSHSLHEMEFTLAINNHSHLATEVADLISNYFGNEHPFSRSCRTLGSIESGFLVGFIDLFFEDQGKYWVLDYKTNTLNDYSAPKNCLSHDNLLIESMAEHHYYLQYLLYLVAIKRYLEQCLNIADTSDLLGGAVYFYVRGIYTTKTQQRDGIYCDDGCQELVAQLDLLLRGST